MSQSKLQSTSDGQHLVRQIGLGSGVAIVVGSMIGSGIFRSPSDIAYKLPGPLPMLAVWVVGGLFALCGALTFSEIGGAFPYSGGIYVYIREAYGRLLAFMFGWANLLLQPASNGAVALVFSEYALRLANIGPGHPLHVQYTATLALCAIVTVTVANVVGVKFGAGIQNLTTAAKVGGLVALIVLSLVLALPHAGSHFTPAIPAAGIAPSMFGLALVSVLFACDGWMTLSYIGGEVANPRKNLPRAIVLGVFIVTSIYVLANVSYLSVFDIEQMGQSKTIAADSMANLIGTGGVTFIVATVMMSTFGALNAGVFTSPRIYFAMAEDRLFFDPLSRVHPRYKTPHIAIILSGVQSGLYVLLATALRGSEAFNALINACVIGNLPFYALAVGSVFVFRQREKKRKADAPDSAQLEDSLVDPVTTGHLETHPHSYEPPVHTPLYPLPPLLFIGSTLFLMANSLLNPESCIPSLIVLAILGAGALLYLATIGRSSTRGA